MTIFIVTVYRNPDVDHIYGVYSTKEKAQTALQESGFIGHYVERELDE